MDSAITNKSLMLKTGYRIPVLGMGTWQLSGRKCTEAVEAAIDSGYRHFDTAEAYKNEEYIGHAIKKIDRSEIFITSKVSPSHFGYEAVLKACRQSLDKLGSEYLDLYLLHWPNDKIRLSETMQAMGELVNRKMIRSAGLSNFDIGRIKKAIDVSPVPICNDQVEYHPFTHRVELPNFCRENDIILTAYSPLARGRVFENSTLQDLAKRHSKTPAQITLRWLTQKGIVVIPKASSIEHLKDNMSIADFELSAEEMQMIDNIKAQERLIDRSFT